MKESNENKDLKPKDWTQVKALRGLWKAYFQTIDAHKAFFQDVIQLSLTEFDMIAALGNTSGLRMSDLTKPMITSPANVTRVAVNLEKRGLVQRKRAPNSDREVIASLTPAGKAYFKENFMKVVHFSSAAMDGALTTREQEQLARLCGKIAAKFQPPQ